MKKRIHSIAKLSHAIAGPLTFTLLASVSSTAGAAASDQPLSDAVETKVSVPAAAPVLVQMKSISFEPKVIQLDVGQKVIWKNVSLTPHSATANGAVEKSQDGKSSEGAFDTGLIDPKTESKPIVFTSPGSYPYHCSVHGKTMSGVVVVKRKM